MKNQYIETIHRIEFSVTYSCSSKCRHCSVGGRRSPAPVDAGHAVRMIEEVTQNYPVHSLMTFGGEPLLYPDTVCAIHAAAARGGIKKRQLITNGCFSHEVERVDTVAGMLIKSGVNEILLSVDAFHSEHLSLEEQYRFAQALYRYGVAPVLQPAWLVGCGEDNVYNIETRCNLNYFKDLELKIGNGNVIFPAGNAKEQLSDYFEKQPLDFSFRCGDAPYTTALDHVNGLSVDPSGDVMICSFPIGNIYEKEILEIISEYSPHENEWMKALLQDGVKGLLDLARTRQFSIHPEDFFSPCDLCQEIVRLSKI